MSLITAVSGLGQGFALLVTVYTCGWRYGPCPKALMMYNSEGERRHSHLLGVLCSSVLALRKCSSVLVEN